jgi:pimeloyl-ACP methyl ester carboxylesterase
VITSQHWQQRVGSQRDWVWRGWQTRYTYIRPTQPTPKTTPLILLHGLVHQLDTGDKFSGTRRTSHCLCTDMLGFGASEKPKLAIK